MNHPDMSKSNCNHKERNMREIGGYIELDTYGYPMLHEEAIALNCGRNALAYLIRARKIRHLWIPKLICDSIPQVCDRETISYAFYDVGMDLLPAQEIELKPDEWFYFVNYYSQFDNDTLVQYTRKYSNIIIDHAQSYYQLPLRGVDTIYTCRKYFGVADGAVLYTETKLDEDIPQDESFERVHFLLGRYERNAHEFYREYAANNELFITEPIKIMSRLTRNMLHGINYERTKAIREENYAFLQERFGKINQLKLSGTRGTFMYPLLISNGDAARKKLQQKRIYIPTLWPSVYDWCREDETEYTIARDTLPLPIDQRYKTDDMEYMANIIDEILEEN